MCRNVPKILGISGDIGGPLGDLSGTSEGPLGELFGGPPAGLLGELDPGARPGGTRQRPGSALAAPPAAPWQHPGSTLAAPWQHPGSAMAAQGC